MGAIQGSLRIEQLHKSLDIGDNSRLPKEEQLTLGELVEEYSELFAVSSSELGWTSLVRGISADPM